MNTNTIETATRCSCGHPIELSVPYPGRWQALCRDCYDGTEDAGEVAHCVGRADTADEALWAWQDAHDEAWEVEWVLSDMFGELAQQVSEETDRQRGWSLECASSGNPPHMCPIGGELVCGPPESIAAAAAHYAAL